MRIHETRRHEDTNHKTEDESNHYALIATNVPKKYVLLVANHLSAFAMREEWGAYISTRW